VKAMGHAAAETLAPKTVRAWRLRGVLTLLSTLLLVPVLAGLLSPWGVLISYDDSLNVREFYLYEATVGVMWESFINGRPPTGWKFQMAYGGFKINLIPGAYYDSYMHGWRIGIPLVYPTILLSILPILWVLPFYRRYKRRASGCCEYCGYSLQGLSERRCPECGKSF